MGWDAILEDLYPFCTVWRRTGVESYIVSPYPTMVLLMPQTRKKNP